MRNLYLFMMVTLDGYFEGPNHDISWHNTDEDFSKFVMEQDGQVGTILFGRRTYEMMASFWSSAEGRAEPEGPMMNHTEKIVFSHDLPSASWENTRIVRQNAAEEVRKLKAQSGKSIAIFGSNNFTVSIMDAGVIDEFRIMVNPVALGAGTSLFAGLKTPAKFKLIDRREFTNGNVLLTYKPATS